MIKGYKCFNKDLTNRYGTQFEIGKTYKITNPIKFGKNGFHMCTNIEDTFRYFDAINEEVSVCEVLGFGNKQIHNDEYYGYYDMYSVEKIKIIRVIPRDEIINIELNLNEFRVTRFIQGFKLTKEEILLFKDKFNISSQLLNAIAYYQEKDIDVYTRKYQRTNNFKI